MLGGFDNRKTGVLYSGSKQAIKDETKRLLEETGTVGVILVVTVQYLVILIMSVLSG